MFMSCTISKHVAYNPPHHITQYWVFQSLHVYRRRTFPNSISSTWLFVYVHFCVGSSFSLYVAPPITPCTDCAWQCHSDCETTCHTWCCCAGRGRNKYRDVHTQRGVIMGALVNTHFCGVSVHGDVSRGARRHRTPCMLTLFASTHNMNMCVSSNSHKYMWTQTVGDEYERPKDDSSIYMFFKSINACICCSVLVVT